MPHDEVRRALATSRWDLLSKQNVVAVGIGYKVTAGRRTDVPSIVCSVTAKRPRSQLSALDLIPDQIATIPTDVIQTGPIFALAERTDRQRPAPGGVSVGHTSVTAGTLGCLVRREGQLHILSNNHVLANSNDAVEGDAILQPGPADGGRAPEDQIARLAAWVPIALDEGPGGIDLSDCPIAGAAAGALNAVAAAVGSRTRLRPIHIGPRLEAEDNLVDAAIAEIVDEGVVSQDILGIGTISGLGEVALGVAIKKSGRTTALTTGTVLQTDVTVRVSYGAGRVATFADQLMAGAMSQGGDSGSAVLDGSNRLVGLLFAGSTNSTIINRIQHVFSALGLSLP